MADSEIGEIRRTLQRIETNIEDRANAQRRETVYAREWRTIGQCFDRLFFMSYAFMIVLSIVVFFPRPKEDNYYPTN